jgi:hypothetical protein
MDTKRIIITSLVAVSLTAFGCTEAELPKSEAIEQATSTEPTLTSTVATPTPAEEKKPEPPVEAAEAKPEVEAQPVASSEPTLQSMDGLTIKRLVTAPAIEHREPVAASSVFGHHDETVYAFVDVSNESEEEKTLMVHFIGPDEQASGGIELRIPPKVPRWRTWAYNKHAKKPGLWRVEIRSVDGTVLGALPFEVEPGR